MPAPVLAAIGAGARAVGTALARGTAMAARTGARVGATTAKYGTKYGAKVFGKLARHGGRAAAKTSAKAAQQGGKTAARAGTQTAQHGARATARASGGAVRHGGRATGTATRGPVHITGRAARTGPTGRSTHNIPRTGSGNAHARAQRVLDNARGRQHPTGRANHNQTPGRHQHHLGRADPNGRVARLLRNARNGERQAPKTFRQRVKSFRRNYQRYRRGRRAFSRLRERLDPRNNKFNRKRKKAQRRLRRVVFALFATQALIILVPFVVALAVLGNSPDARMLQQAMAPDLSGQGGIPPGMLAQVSQLTGIPTCAGRTPPRYGESAAPGCVPALESYSSAGAARGVDWTILAGIGEEECDHGRSPLPGCDRRGSVNMAGARGPMQFLGSTWRGGSDTYDPDVSGRPIRNDSRGYATDGNGNGVADPWEWLDATHAAARYLLASGLDRDKERAIFQYNRSNEYVADVLGNAERYRTRTASLNLGAATGPRIGATGRYVDPNNTARMQRVIDEVIATFGRGVKVGCFRAGDPQDHGKGRACDYMLSSGGRMPTAAYEQHGHRLAQWLITHHRRLGVRYIIWQQKIWHVDDPRWRLMEDRGSITQNHFDHVHISVQP